MVRADEGTPSKRQRTEGEASSAAATPATPGDASSFSLPLVFRHKGVSLARLAADVGSLAAATSRHPRFASSELYGSLLESPASEDWGAWLVLEAAPRSGGERVTWLAMDVEMCERRSDGARFPVSVCVKSIAWVGSGSGVAATQRTVIEGLVDPGDEVDWRGADADRRLDWKDEIHGLTRAAHAAAPRLYGVGEVQAAIAKEVDDLTFLVGHKLCGDLKALRIRGAPLRRRAVDTMLLHWGPRMGAPGLRALLAAVPDAGDLGGFQAGSHDAGDDVNATVRVALHDLARCGDGLDVGPAFAPRHAQAVDDRPRSHFEIPEALVGRLIGKKGAVLAALRAAAPAVDVDVASAAHPLKPTRLVKLRAADPAAIAHCLDQIKARVPNLARITDEAKRELAEAVLGHAPPAPPSEEVTRDGFES